MANIFEEMDAKRSGSPRVNVFEEMDAKRGAAPTPPEPAPMWQKAMNSVYNTLRSANDTMTFGMWDKLLGKFSGLDEAAKTADIRRNDPVASVVGDVAGMMVPSGLASKGIATASKAGSKLLPRVIPNLDRPGIPQAMLREGLAGAGVTAADEGIRTGDVDPGNVALSGALAGGTTGVLSGIGRVLSPGARVRAIDPAIPEQDLLAAKAFADDAKARGVQLNIPEALDTVAPENSGRVVAQYNTALTAPAGKIAAKKFNAERTPGILAAGRGMIDELGPGIHPADASRAAEDAIGRRADMVQQSASPYYDASKNVTVKVDPLGADNPPTIQEAIRRVEAQPAKLYHLKGDNGVVDRTSVGYWDAIKKELDTMHGEVAGRGKGDAVFEPIIANEAKNLRTTLDAASPEYSTARGIVDAGTRMVEDTKAGPLGRIAQTPDVPSQGQALFGATNNVEEQMAERAMKDLSPDITRAMLSNYLDTAVSNKPITFGRTAFPTEQSARLAEKAAGPAADDISGTIQALKSVQGIGKIKPQFDTGSGGLFSEGYGKLRDMGRGSIIDALNDPEWLKKMGKIGSFEQLMRTLATSTAATAVRDRR